MSYKVNHDEVYGPIPVFWDAKTLSGQGQEYLLRRTAQDAMALAKAIAAGKAEGGREVR